MRLFNTGVESPQFRLRGQTPNQPIATDANRDLVTKTPADFRALIEAANAPDVNLGTSFEGTADPFVSAQRFANFDRRGGVRTWQGVGPFSGGDEWYNVVDVTHRNGLGDGASGYGGILAWGMVSHKTRMAFGSRAADGTYSWTEVWTKANLPDDVLPRTNVHNTWTGGNTYQDGVTKETSASYSGPSGFVLLGEMLITGSGGGVNVEVDVFDANQSTNLGTLVSSGTIIYDCYQAGSMSLALQRVSAQGSKWSGYLNPAQMACYSIATNNSTEKRIKIYARCVWGAVNFRIKSIAVGSATFTAATPVAETPSSPVYAKNTHERIGTGEIDDLAIVGMRFRGDPQIINGSNAAMTGTRAVITDTINRIVTLPDPANHSVAVLMVKTTPLVKHRVYPPSGSSIYWTAHDGVWGQTDSTGAPALRVTLGMYWFVSDGVDWYLMSPCTD